MAVRRGAAGLFLSPSPIRDHRAYHDGSVYIYQQNTQQKTQTRLCVQQSTPLKVKEALDCEDFTVFATTRTQGMFGHEIDQPWPLDRKVHIK